MIPEARSQELVVGCLAASAVVAAGSTLAGGQVPGMRLVIGLSFTGLALATASMVVPDLAGSFAVLILTSTVFVYGGPLVEAVTGLTGGGAYVGQAAPSLATTTHHQEGTVKA